MTNPNAKEPCCPGAASICKGWTDEKNWWERRKAYFCFKCGREIKYNGNTNRWRHVKNGGVPLVRADVGKDPSTHPQQSKSK